MLKTAVINFLHIFFCEAENKNSRVIYDYSILYNLHFFPTYV